MKKIILTITIALLSHFIYAQNTFPSTGSAGIGTTAPTSSLTFGSTTTGIAAYNTADQTTNYEKVTQAWSGNIYSIGFTVGGTGTVRALQLGSSNFVNTITLNAFRGITFSTSSGSAVSGGHYAFEGTFNGTGSGSQSVVGIAPTITQTLATGYTALFISPFENTLGTGNRYLIDAGTNTAAGGGAVTHTSKFRIDDTGNGYFLGNVGIGTTDGSNWQLATSPYKLNVGGGLIATAVTVKLASNWPDYVFKKDYSLPSLESIKTYIDQNHHLPDVPSALDVEKAGINLGEMNKVLMKKVEELTLYLIEKDKKEQEQKQQLDLMKMQLKEQEERLNKLEKQLNSGAQK